MDEHEVAIETRGWWPRWLAVLLGFLLLILVISVALWTQRTGIATDYIQGELQRRGVQATYEVKRIGFRTQRLENLVVGDPARPDLTARWVEVEISFGFRNPRVELIRARGVRMRGRLVDGKLKLGDIDKMMPPPSGAPFRLPDQRIDLSDAAIALDTPAGRIGLGVEGRGNLSNGFKGYLAAVSRGLDVGSCRLSEPNARVAVSVANRRPTFRGPLILARARCGDAIDLTRPRFAVNTTLSEGFDSWAGKGLVAADRARAGPHVMAALSGGLSFSGDLDATRGDMDLASGRTQVGDFAAGRGRIDGRYVVSPRTGNVSLLANAAVGGLVVGGGALTTVVAPLRSVAGTPLEPVGAAIADAIVRAARGGSEARGSVRLVNGRGFGAVRFERLSAASRSGARLAASGGQGITYYWPSNEMRMDGDFAVAGGGLPSARFALSQPRAGGPISGTGRMAPFAAGNGRLALGDIRFAGGSGGTILQTVATMDGPFSGGRVTGLTLPVRARFGGGGFVMNEGCVDSSFRAVQVQSLNIGPARLALCPTERALLWKAPTGRVQGGAAVHALRLSGRLGQTPIGIVSDTMRYTVGDRSFTGTNAAVELGREPWISRFRTDTLAGRFGPNGIAGTFGGFAGRIGTVPLLMSEGSAAWTLQRGAFAANGRLQIDDAQDPVRFNPLISDDFRLTLVDNHIHATAWLKHPDSGTRVTQATVDHNLRNGVGQALLDVPGINFQPDFQPDLLTPLTLGVIALVEGTVRGQGRIDWRPGASSSTGTFSTEGMNLAAPFGPVEGLTTTVRFTDLLRLQSAPGQIANIDRIRTGIDVFDGMVRYQLLPDLRVRVEGGRWPFAGGELILQETILDFSQPSNKRLTFRVEGLDAALLVQQMEFANISVTGIFDGVIPMEFDQNGGRVVGGRLAAREEGGTLSYIGELTDQQLGAYGKLAFDALKSLRYSKLIIVLNGTLDGEFLTQIELDGIARNSDVAPDTGGGIRGLIAGRAFNQLAKIPFEFNIAIRGPFRAVLATTRSFSDPTLLIQPVLPEVLRDLPTTINSIQREESETEP